MPATLFPLPISVNSVAAELEGVYGAVETIAERAFPSAVSTDDAVESLISQGIRAAAYEMENRSQIPFFVTRYCTRKLATSGSLTIGTDFDLYSEPLTYNHSRWMRQSARTDTHRAPITTVTQLQLLLSGDGGTVYDVDTEWLQIGYKTGQIHVIPSGIASAGLAYQSIFSVGIQVRSMAVGHVPLLVHIRYSAGLVRTTGSMASPESGAAYDPDSTGKNTDFDQNLVEQYQYYLGRLSASKIMSAVGAYLSKGGVSISLDGLSEQVNSQELAMRSDAYEKECMAWADTLRDRMRGPQWTML